MAVSKANRLEHLIFLPVVGVLLAIWAVVVAFTVVERGTTIDRAKAQLEISASSLADFNDLAERVTSADEATATRTAAIWRTLLQYPTAIIWVEKDGQVTDGQPAEAGQGSYIFVEEKRPSSTVHIALPLADVLADWQTAGLWRAAILVLVTAVLLVLTHFLVRAVAQRAFVEQKMLVAQERTVQLATYQKQLEETVALRTNELKVSNDNLEKELVERTAAETTLREHDALLNAVTRSASELLGSNRYGDAISVVLELIAQTVMAGRVQLNSLTPDHDGHLRSTVAHEWCPPEGPSTLGNPAFRDLDVMLAYPKTFSSVLAGEPASFSLTDIPPNYRGMFQTARMQSFLQIPINVNGKLWGFLSFIDSLHSDRQWTWAETDALKTLGGLVGAAITRARFVKELADANMIVENSPTVLYRLRAEPSFPLAYISQNIAKFGHDPAELLALTNWADTLVHAEDREKVGAAMAQLLEKDAQGSRIEFRILKGDGTLRWVEDRYTPVRDKIGRLTEIEGIIIDITERKAAEEKIALLARTDSLTGLANRGTFTERLQQAFAAATRGAGAFAILYLDIDHFKDVNDTLGHPIGDLLLKQVAERLKSCTRESDTVARLGGDEFAVLQGEMSDPADAGELAKKILHAMAVPFSLNESEVRVTVSIGVCPYAASGAGPDVMLTQADLALYRAKEQGRNQFRFHTQDLDMKVLARVALGDELRKAIEQNELELYYQPQVNVLSGKITGVEALVRWHHPTRGLLSAGDFLSIAEQTGAIVPLGRWVLDRACQQMHFWREDGVAPPTMTINLSLSQLKNGRNIVQDVIRITEKWGVSPSDFEFDVTEATIAHLTWTQNDVLAQLRKLGASIAIDDFGTEYSSFEYLRSYNVNHLKIAPSLIASASTDSERAAIVRVMINMARELGIGIMAEGVENEEERKLMIESGSAAKAQGYYFSGAVEASRVGELLRQQYIKRLPQENPPEKNAPLPATLTALAS